MVAGIVLTIVIILLILQSIFEDVDGNELKYKDNKKMQRINDNPRVTYFMSLLNEYYVCKEPFSIVVHNCKPKKYMGLYYPGDARIVIYAGWQKYYSLDDIALHEYAHHIQHTEYPETVDPDNCHNIAFWMILDELKNRSLKCA